MTKAEHAARDERNRAAFEQIARERLVRGVCRHCAGKIPCPSSFGDAEVGKRWRDLTARERRIIEKKENEKDGPR